MIVSKIKIVKNITMVLSDMSGLLRPYPLDKLEMSNQELLSMTPAPIIITFSPTGYQPISLFHVLLSRLLCKNYYAGMKHDTEIGLYCTMKMWMLK